MKSLNEEIKWGVVGTGKISSDFCQSLVFCRNKNHILKSVGSRNLESAKEFAKKFNIENIHESYESLFRDGDINVIYVGTVTSNHFESCKGALLAGKHVLCEKPLSLCRKESLGLIELAKSKNLLLVEGVWTKFTPAFKKMREMLKNGSIGEINNVEINFGLKFDWNSNVQITKKHLGGGVTMGLGCYAFHLCCALFPNQQPIKILSSAIMSPTGLDQEVEITLVYEGDKKVLIKLSTLQEYPNHASIQGRNQTLVLCNFWCCEIIKFNSHSEFFKFPEFETPTFYPKTNGFVFEIEAVGDSLRKGKLETEEANHQETLDSYYIIDQVLSQLGVKY